MSSNLRDFTLIFQANQEQELSVVGNFFGILNSENYLYFSIDGGPFVKRGARDFQTTEFSSLRAKSLVAQTALVIAGFGNFTSSSQTVAVVATATIENGNNTVALGDVVLVAGALTQIVAANANRKGVIIKALNGNDPSVFVRVGTGAGAAAGAELGAGEAMPLIESTAAIDAFNPSALDFTVSILEVNKL